MRCSKTLGTSGAPGRGPVTPKLQAAGRSEGGFTLVEVMVALAILGVVAVVLLGQRVEVVREADRTRAKRVGWTLAAWKMGEIERDERLFEGTGRADRGGFEELSADYGDFGWEYEANLEQVPTNDPSDPADPPKEIFRLKLRVLRLSTNETLIELEGMYPRRETGEDG
jgi:prepilin-type N-terminal cleavage/methylation domain-containing protein